MYSLVRFAGVLQSTCIGFKIRDLSVTTLNIEHWTLSSWIVLPQLKTDFFFFFWNGHSELRKIAKIMKIFGVIAEIHIFLINYQFVPLYMQMAVNAICLYHGICKNWNCRSFRKVNESVMPCGKISTPFGLSCLFLFIGLVACTLIQLFNI